MKNRKPVLLLFVLFILFMACNTISLEKRRYNSGYYVDITKRAKPTRKGNEPITNKSFSVAETHPSDSLNILGNAPNYASTKKNAIHQLNEVPKSALAKKLPHENKITFEKSIHSPQSNANDNYSHKKAIKETQQNTYLSDLAWLSFAGVFGFMALLLLKRNLIKLKPISHWAKANPNKTKAIILSSKAILGGAGLFLGSQLATFDVFSTSITTKILFGLLTLTTIFYPHSKHSTGIYKSTFQKQKLFSFAITFTGFLMMVNIGNRLATGDNFTEKTIPILNTAVFKNMVMAESHSSNQDLQTEMDGKVDWKRVGIVSLKVLLSIIAIALFLATLYLIAIISCAIACEGAEIVAVAVAVLGLGGALYLIYISFKYIWSNWDAKKKETKTVATPQ